MKPILGKPLVSHIYDRVMASKRIDKVVLATSTDASDVKLVEVANQLAIPVHTGALDDVLGRFLSASKLYHPDSIVRITADCPLIDPNLIDLIIDYFKENCFDIATNALRPTFPDGLDCEVFTYDALRKAGIEAVKNHQREHVTPYFYEHPELFKIGNFVNDVDLSHLRWTVDYQDDFEFVEAVYKSLYENRKIFHMEDVLALLNLHPELLHTNQNHARNEGTTKG